MRAQFVIVLSTSLEWCFVIVRCYSAQLFACIYMSIHAYMQCLLPFKHLHTHFRGFLLPHHIDYYWWGKS